MATPIAVIPVLDLLGGQVVRAVRGDRGNYRAMQSALAAGSDALPLARALLAHPACSAREPVLYVADLDAIQRGAAQIATLQRLLRELLAERPALRLWLDAGFATTAAAGATIAAIAAGDAALAARIRPVHGTESIASLADLEAIGREPDAILSLDCRRAEAMDPAGCWQQPQCWPPTLIVMTLDRVGAASGPDFDTFASLRERAPGRRLVGAGGLRDAADLRAAARAGAAGWLVATALHDGTLDIRG